MSRWHERAAVNGESGESRGPGNTPAEPGAPRAGPAGRPPAWVVEDPRNPSPPDGNTGGKLTRGLSVKLDWLNVTFPEIQRPNVRDAVARYLGQPEDRDYGRHTYSKSWAWPTGAMLCWSEGRQEAFLSLNGDSIDCIPLGAQLGLLVELQGLGARCSRLDVAVDDYDRRVTVEQVRRAVEAGDFHGYRVVEDHRQTAGVGANRRTIGDGITFGRRGKEGSGRSLQVYDKTLESCGEIDAIRWEARFYKETAAVMFETITSSLTERSMVGKLQRAVGGAVDFVARGDHVHVNRMPRLDWWAAFVDLLGSARLVVHRVKPPLQKFVEYARRSLMPSFALVRQVLDSAGYHGAAILAEMIDEGEKKLGPQHYAKRYLGLSVSECFG